MDLSVLEAYPAFAWSLVVFLGLVFGSFTTVLVHRLPRNESIFRPRSKCPSCGRSIAWYHNIPVVSWAFLRGRCGFCRAGISWVYPAIELACAALFAVFYLRYGVTTTTLAFWYLSVTLLAAFVIDVRERIIPNTLTYPGVVVGILFAIISPHIIWWQSLLGAAVGLFGFMGVAYLGTLLFKKESLGGGDIKLAAVLGAFLGAEKLVLVLIVSAVVGLVASVAAMAVSPALRRDRVIPFGPFLAIAAVVAAVAGDRIIALYLSYVMRSAG